MVQPYRDQLEHLVHQHLPDDPNLVCKHFFAGAALYSGGVICASLTPVGLAFKLPDELCREIIESKAASHLRYFPKAPVKKGYALFATVEALSEANTTNYFRMAVAHARQKHG